MRSLPSLYYTVSSKSSCSSLEGKQEMYFTELRPKRCSVYVFVCVQISNVMSRKLGAAVLTFVLLLYFSLRTRL